MRSHSEKLSWSLGAAFFALLWFFKWAAEASVEMLFKSNSWGILNLLVRTTETQSLGVYQGEIERMYIGPLFMIFAGVALVIISKRFFASVGIRKFCFFVFVFLVLTKLDILFFPPYGDAVAGPFVEAVWLKSHGFDYVGLAHQPGYIYGGPKVYLFSIYPTFLAITMKLIPSGKFFLLFHHLVQLFLGALTITYLRQILLIFVSPIQALWGSVLFVATPLFQAQAEIINMEMPMVTFSIVALYAVMRKNIGWAAFFAILAFMVKGTAIFIGATIVMASVLLYFFDDILRWKWKLLLAPLGIMAFAFLQAYGSFFVLNEKGSVDMVGPFYGWHHIKTHVETYIFIISAFLFLWFTIQEKIRENLSWVGSLRKHYAGWVTMIATTGWFAVFINSMAGIDRYKLILLPLVFLCIFYAASFFVNSERLLNRLLPIIIVLSFGGSYGLCLPRLKVQDYITDHTILERSLEYRTDIVMQMRIAKLIEEKYSDYLIGAPFITAQMLAFPELGFVQKGLDVMIYGFPCKYGGIKVFKSLSELNLQKTVWVGLKSDLKDTFIAVEEYPVSKYDVIVDRVAFGGRETVLFKGGVAIEKARLVTKEILKQLANQGKLGDIHTTNFWANR